jgi:hypothetical protein
VRPIRSGLPDRAGFRDVGKFDDIKGETAEQAVATVIAEIRAGRSWGMSDSDYVAFI